MKNIKFLSFWIVPLAIALSACQGGSPGTADREEAAAKPSAEAPKAPAATESAADASQVAARVGDETILVSQIDQQIESQLQNLEMQRYQARKGQLDNMIQMALLEREAKERGVSTDELLQQEVEEQVTPPTDEEVRQYYERHKDQIRGEFEQLEPRIRQGLLSQKEAQRRQQFLSSLREGAAVTIALEPPRVSVDTTSGVAKGDPDAPITLVEFSDFECPFCARSQAAVDQVLERYGDKVRHVFMDFPLTSMHPEAMTASVAARCAGDQDKYWEYQERLFQHQKQFSRENYEKWAGDLDLDTEAFSSCLDSGKHQNLVTQSLQEGQKAGVRGTPAFFINGVMISGAQPFEAFQEIIDSELERVS